MKYNRENLVKDIENTEIYKDQLAEEFKKYQFELEKINRMYCLFINLSIKDSLEEKYCIFNVYDKILKDSDNAYTKVRTFFHYFRSWKVLKHYIKW